MIMKRASPRFLKTVPKLVSLLIILVLADCTGLGSARNQGDGPESPGSAPRKETAEGEGRALPERPAPETSGGAPPVDTAGSAESGAAAPGTGPDAAPPDKAAASAGSGAPPAAPGAAADTSGSNTAEPENAIAGTEADSDTADSESGGSDTVAAAAGTESPAESKEEALSPESNVLLMDIRTSTLTELASWCRSLGLSEGGSREELAGRLRTHYGLPQSGAPEDEESAGSSSKKKTIVIESARSTEYFTLEVVDEEYARLRGDVVVNLKDGEAVHRIKAAEILYNRTRNIMSASGGVEYVKEDGDKTETYRGESITVNLDNWASVLMDSVSERSMANDGTTYRFAGTLITRSDEEVTIMTNATITSPKESESYWSINAKKLWLLPGSDWAIRGAVLKVGDIPVLPIPAFFFPADEVIFHPVLGNRSREGTFSQNTFYIWGRPTASASSESSSISKILGSSTDDEKVREGIFLRSTGKKSRDHNDKRLSLKADFYSNLGIYLGADFMLPAKSPFGPLDVSAGVGFTRTVYQVGGSYTPFVNLDGVSDWNSSNFFSTTIPIRYRFTAATSLTFTYGSLTLNFPFYSDPKVDHDFLNRSEEMDWIAMLTDDGTDETNTTDRTISSYSWNLAGSINPRIQFLAPYISSLSISGISSTLSFQSKTAQPKSGEPRRSEYDPNYNFFYPGTFTIASFSIPISGAPLTLGGPARANAATKPAELDDPWEQGPLKNIGIPRSPWDTADTAKASESANPYDLKPPVLTNARFELPRSGSTRFTINYGLTPAVSSTMQFRSSNWKEPEDVNWSEISSIITSLRADANTSFALTDSSTNAYSATMQLLGNANWRDYSFINEEAEEFDTPAEKEARVKEAYDATSFATRGNASATLRPLFWNTMWANTSLAYNFGGEIAQSKYDKTGTIDDPSWDIEYGGWNKEKITTHAVSANLSASVMDKVQTLSISANLPPREASLGVNANMQIWKSTTTFSETITEPFDDDKRKFGVLVFSETLAIAPGYSVSISNLSYDPELKEFTNLSASLTLKEFNASFGMNRVKPYILDPAVGWVQQADEAERFSPATLTMNYARRFGQDKLWKGRFSWNLNLSTSLTLDMQRYTNSRFNFNLDVGMRLTNFLDLTFGSRSTNTALFRYVQDWFDLDVELPGEKNLFIDLFNSFRFDREDLRRSSGFKLTGFNMKLTHHLGDWDASLSLDLSSQLKVAERRYEFTTAVSFLVQWTPISEIKTDIYKDKDGIIKTR
ncbi:hypothetical protein FACS189473_3370 [Spirochaetia bacterium]|nr:hypothetical protein FACS189473_3370 [Spirochaetia bacterium]